MSFLIPDYSYRTIYDIDFEKLKKEGIKLVLVDIDNTIIAWDSVIVNEKLIAFFDELKDSGFVVRILSNAPKERAKEISKKLGVKGIGRSYKPFSFNFKKSINSEGFKKSETIMIGDQIFTDLLGAKLAGIKVILVDPISKKELKVTKFMRLLEKFIRK
ncbi:MAG: YqeG family HAD IIIA-type phosphatase [Clostridia bacterium]